MRILVIGAGGHGQVVADILRSAVHTGDAMEFAGFLDDGLPESAVTHVRGGVDSLADVPHDAVIVAVGDNATRGRISERLRAAGTRLAVARHSTAIVAGDVHVGEGTMLCAGSIAAVGVQLGRGVILNTGSVVDHDSIVGDYTHIAPGVRIGGEVSIGEGAFIGIGAIVLPRLTIGRGSTVGAGAVVTRNVPPDVTVIGVPARLQERAELAIAR